ncbi:MAG: PmoA family protein [Prolixibacteraceae bacterium]|jgi:hypothetical protein|nr:PmoA family protein [Prolixibacteraceae bacterium]
MRTQSISIVLLAVLIFSSCGLRSNKQHQGDMVPEVTFAAHEADQRVDVMVDGKLFTSYCWYDKVLKPILYPVFTSAGTEITRGFPLKTREGERNDHPHQVGIWLNYGNVNGTDFWGNGSQGFGTKNENGGVIKHLTVEKMTGGIGEGAMSAIASWTDPAGKELLAERTEFHFVAKDSIRIIDRITTLTATGGSIVFNDTKEGMLGIRVARQLELPSNDDIALTDAKGNLTTVKALSNEGVTGNFISSEGVAGGAVWGTRAKWIDLYGSIGNEKISLVVCDHPKNLNFPTWWHARGYGLFAANPLGVKDFTQGKDSLNYTIPAGQSLTFRYRVIISSGVQLTNNGISVFADDFAKKY